MWIPPPDGTATLYLTIYPRHDVARVRQTRALTSTGRPSATRTRDTGQNPKPEISGTASLPCVCCGVDEKMHHDVSVFCEHGHDDTMSMLANSERITVGWLVKNPYFCSISLPLSVHHRPSLIRLIGCRIVIGLTFQGRPHKSVKLVN